jgi:hypothetical protein
MSHTQPFPGANVSHLWQTTSPNTDDADQAQFEIYNLPAAQTSVGVQLTITNLDSGCVATGTLAVSTYTAEYGSRTAAFCKLRHVIAHLLIPRLINPFGPDDPELGRFVENNLPEIRRAATQIQQLTNDIDAINQEAHSE